MSRIMPKAKGKKVKLEVEEPEIGLPLSPPAEHYHHIRIRAPKRFDENSFRVITFDKGIKATIGCPKGKYNYQRQTCKVGTKIQKLLFPKQKYTLKEAENWMKKHPRIKLKKKKKK